MSFDHRLVLGWVFFLCSCHIGLNAADISIQIPPSLNDQAVTRLAIDDVKSLLSEACACDVDENDASAKIILKLPEPSAPLFSKIKHEYPEGKPPTFYYPECGFEWSGTYTNGKVILELATPSYEGVASALYALLQEKLGFRFYHPRETIVPRKLDWDFSKSWNWKVKERFRKRGFHLHTMHPLELTEPLLDENFPDGLNQIKEYIDWLARNGQNYFEWNLLSSIEIDTWIPYAKQIVDYGHQRGMIMGIDISLNMVQQKAFKLYRKPPASFRTKKNQVLRNLNHLAEAGFDVYNIEMSSTEYTSGNSGKRHELMDLILQWGKENSIKIIGRAHVVKKGDAVLNYSGEVSQVDDAERGVLIHTVMFYELNDEKAPVYGSPNLKHMFDLLKKEQGLREIWYFPESAYWVTFDNSVPMFLLPYLSARLTDIQGMEQEGIEGHMTFSSGWEWGYWLFDWSIARWSWKYTDNEDDMDAVSMLVDEKSVGYVREFHRLQDYYFKDKELMRYLVAQSVLDEVPKRMSREFHPRPRWRYPYLFKKADKEELDSFYQEGIVVLDDFILEYEKVLNDFKNESNIEISVLEEWLDGIEITLLRAKHRSAVLKSIYYHRKNELEKRKDDSHLDYLAEAEKVRMNAQEIVDRREQGYRYDVDLMTTKRKGHTAYHFGYLYPVSDLHFWFREEMQVRKNRWGFPFMNIWDVGRIMGLKK